LPSCYPQKVRGIVLGAALLLASRSLSSQDLKEFEKKVTEFTLPNGLHFLIVERHEAPVVSFHTYVNAGSANDPAGLTGLAHMFEHMAFKGTENIGTTNWAEEKKALQSIEDAYDQLEAERNKGPKASPVKLASLDGSLKLLIGRAESYVDPNKYTTVIEENGGAGVNADTNLGYTEYFYSLPSNRIELWFLLESQRFLHPVFREFYKERDVVMEEHRRNVDSSVQGLLSQTFKAAAFEASPYRNPPGGWPSDIASLRVSDARAFFEKYYVPANINIAIVGDVMPAGAKRMAERYFGPLPAHPLPPTIHTQEPPQPGPKTVVVESPSQPLALIGYKRPDQFDKDDPVFDAIAMILSNGRTSMLYKDMVQEKRLALGVQAIPTFPDGQYANLFVFFMAPAQGHGIEENQRELEAVLGRFEAKPVDAETLARVKTKARASVISRLDSNAGLASLLTRYYGSYGDWRKLFTSIDDINRVTAEDVQRVAVKYFVPKNRTMAYTSAGARQ
jgi:predicted Zn-dependent peptidase